MLTMVNVTISVEPPFQDDVRKLVAALNDHLLPLSPPAYQFGINVEEMVDEQTTLFVARDVHGTAVGCGALTLHDDGIGEVKRMYTMPELRGAGVGARILTAIIELATERGVRQLMLETGSTRDFASAHRLYERAGFRRRGPFHDYPNSGWSAFFELQFDTLAPIDSDRTSAGH